MTDKPDYGDTIEANMLADLVTEGMLLVDACREIGVVYGSTFRRIRENPKFQEMMEEARKAGYEVRASNLNHVARGVAGHSTGDAKRDRLVVETELKLLAVWHPNRYGPKLQVEQKTATINIPASDDPIVAQREYERLMRGDG